MKKCYSCKIEKLDAEFSKCSRSKDGLQARCKSCYSEYFQSNKSKLSKNRREYREKNKQRISELKRIYAEANKEKLKEARMQYYSNNKAAILKKNKEYYEANRERKLQYVKEYRKNNKEARNEYDRSYVFKRKQEDQIFKIKCNLRSRLNKYCKASGLGKRFKTMDSVGLSPSDFKIHIESMFVDGMNWDNYGFGDGKWSIDHVKPLCIATTEEELFTLNHYTNLRPMWWFDNLSKGGKQQGK